MEGFLCDIDGMLDGMVDRLELFVSQLKEPPKSFFDKVIDSAPEFPSSPPEMGPSPFRIAKVKQFRCSLDATLQEMKADLDSYERDIAILKIQEGIMWLGMELKALGTPNPYPSSYDPTSPVVDPTADGLKL